jgi:phosphatidylserine/phosphatidylglycerophosphate/cardiolipin synthase-like enzyme
MYHLTDPNIINMLIAKRAQGVHVQIILDNESLKTAHYRDTFKQLQAGGIEVIASSPLFRITHSKIFIIDSTLAFVSTMNFVEHFMTMRDFGVFTREPSVVRELQSVFNADIENAKNKTMLTPPVQAPNLVWSPVNSEQKIADLINSSRTSLEVTSENLGNQQITTALISAQARGVKVRIITPACDLSNNPWRNYPFLRQMAQAGVDLRLMPAPSTVSTPYMHAKTIISDKHTLFLGSENFSDNSLLYSREVGIVFANPKATGFVGSVFERDWLASMAMPQENPACPKME